MTQPDSPTRNAPRAYRYFDLVMAAFVAVLIASNIASSAKIIDWGLTLWNLPLAFDAGTLLFPISYIFGDILTEVYGYRRSRRVIWTGFIALALTSLYFGLVRIMPGEVGLAGVRRASLPTTASWAVSAAAGSWLPACWHSSPENSATPISWRK